MFENINSHDCLLLNNGYKNLKVITNKDLVRVILICYKNCRNVLEIPGPRLLSFVHSYRRHC